MRHAFFAALVVLLVAGAAEAQAPRDPCSIISPRRLGKLQKSAIVSVKPSREVQGEFVISKCFYEAADFPRSIHITLIEEALPKGEATAVRVLWKRWFGGDSDKGETPCPPPEKRSEKEEKAKPEPVPNTGESAYWISGINSELYVLQGKAILQISVGGRKDDPERLRSAKALATLAVARLDLAGAHRVGRVR
ncbi:MAG: hypothetical protein PHR35_15070 [Kiritimatiellae bacterium]|nr:hypothetical protein [Kiritimatiellia bacterium]